MRLMEKNEIDTLIAALDLRLINRVKDLGIVHRSLSDADASIELKRAFPFGRYVRKSGDDLQLIEIQLDKNGKVKFVINFGVVPPGGVKLPWGSFAQNECGVYELPSGHRLYSKANSMKWFELGFFNFNAQKAINYLVDDACMKFNEVERWFDSGEEGVHTLRYSLYPLQS